MNIEEKYLLKQLVKKYDLEELMSYQEHLRMIDLLLKYYKG